MKKIILSFTLLSTTIFSAFGQKLKSTEVPENVKSALMKKYPKATKITWEKDKLNFEGNWGGKSGEDMSVQFTPEGKFVEQVVAIKTKDLPSGVIDYVKKHYHSTKISEAGKVTNVDGKTMYEAEVGGKDLIFDENGVFLKIE